MARFKYEAKAVNGQSMNGEIDAANEAEARVKLRAQKLFPLRLVSLAAGQTSNQKKGGKKVPSGGVKAKDLQIFTRQFSTLLSSGIPVLQSLAVLGKTSRAPALNAALNGIVEQVGEGRRLADCMGQYGKVFDKLYVNMVRAGEESGNLDGILARLASYIEKSVKIKGKIKGAMFYPAAIVFVAAVVVSALLIFVIPKFQELFASNGQELPKLTAYVVAASSVLKNYWYLIFGGIGGGIFALVKYYGTENGKNTIDRILIDIPLMGDLIQKGAVARFSRTLATLLESGVAIIEALDISSKTVGNIVIETAILRSKEAISEGKSLVVPLEKEKYIPPMVVQMIGVGEQTGNLEQMLTKIADFYEDEVDVAVGALTSMMEPMLMVVLGGIIAVIVIAMYLPIFNMANAIG